MKYSYILLFLLLQVFTSCNRKELTDPTPTSSQTQIEPELSDIYFPLLFPVDQLEEWLNRKFATVFLDHTVDINGELDLVKLQVSKSSDIILTIVDNQVRVTFPLKIEGDLASRKKKDDEESNISAQALLHLLVSPDVDSNWSLITNTRFEKLEWVEEPRIKLAFLKFNVKGVVERFVEDEKNNLIQQLDDVIREKVSLKKDITKIWNNIQKPIPIRKEKPKAYLKLFPESVAGNIVISEETDILINLHVRAYTNIITDSIEIEELIPLSKFKKLTVSINEDFNFNLLATVPYDFITSALNTKVSGNELSTKLFTITPYNFFVYGSDTTLVVKFEVRGDLNGNVVITGLPHFDPDNCKLTITGLNYEVEMEEKFISALANGVQTLLLDKISDFLILDIEDLLSDLPNTITNSIEQGKKSHIFGLTFDKLVINKVESYLNKDDIQILLHSQAAMILDLRAIPVKKKLRLNKK